MLYIHLNIDVFLHIKLNNYNVQDKIYYLDGPQW